MTLKRIIDILPWQMESYPQEDALAGKVNGEWKKYSTAEFQEIADKVSLGLLKMGFTHEDKIGLVSPNRPEWNFIDLGVLQIGAATVPMYPTITEDEYVFILNETEARIVFVAGAELYNKINGIKSRVPSLEVIYCFDKVAGANHWTEVVNAADNSLRDQLKHLKQDVNENDLATIIYTSGTTGLPKGVMLSHKNICSNINGVQKITPFTDKHKALSFLPLCHSFERTVTYMYMKAGVSIYYAESLETIGDNLKEVRPHFFTSVPRLLEKVYEKIMKKGHELTGIKKTLFFWALALGEKFDDMGRNNLWYRIRLAIARFIIFKKWKEALGGNVISIITGAAALQPKLGRVFCAAGIKIREGYGLTETSPVICANGFNDGEWKIGTVGKPLPDVEVKLSDRGEIIVKGPNVMMGYYKNPEKTKEDIDKDGWFHTGDVGEFVDGKFLKITDRLKELFKTSGGKYVAPQQIENKLKESFFVEQVMVVGDGKKYPGAVILPSFLYLEEWVKERNLNLGSRKAMVESPEVREAIQKEIDRFNVSFSHPEQVKNFILVDDEWGIETGELTPTMKLKRKNLMKKYHDRIEEMYGETKEKV